MLLALHHVAVTAEDLEAAVVSYSGLLGRDVDQRVDGASGRSAWFALGNVALELRASSGAASDGLAELGFLVEDVDAAAAWAGQRGLEPGSSEVGSGRAHLATARTGGVPIVLLAAPPLWGTRDEPNDPAVVDGLDHVVVRSRDGDATRRFYEETLGIRVAVDRGFEQWGVRLIFCRIAGVTVEIAAALPGSQLAGGFAASQSRAEVAGAPDAPRDRLWGCSWQVADADRARQRLADAGFDVSEVRKGRRPSTRVFTVRDAGCSVPTLMIEPAKQ